MNTEKELDMTPQLPPTKKEIHDEAVDGFILKLRDNLIETGVDGDTLMVAVARIYSNSVLLAYKEHLSKGE